MGIKDRGINAERELLHKFWDTGLWCAVRVAGSGSMRHPGPDLLVGSKDRNRRLAIECKTSGVAKIYLSSRDIEKLKEFSEIFDARAWFAVKFRQKDWRFLNLEDLKKTQSGYVIDSGIIDLCGISFQEIISYKVEK